MTQTLECRIRNSAEHLRWSFLQKQLTAESRQLFSKKISMQEIWQGS